MRIVVKKRVKGVASHKGFGVQIDSRLPKKYIKTVAYHERAEHMLMHAHGQSYKKAHRRANVLERNKYFKSKPKAWRKYNAICTRIARKR